MVDDPAIELSYLQWCLGVNDQGQPRVTSDAFRDAIRAEVAKRTGGETPPAGTPVETGGPNLISIQRALQSLLQRVEKLEKTCYVTPPPDAGDAWEAPPF